MTSRRTVTVAALGALWWATFACRVDAAPRTDDDRLLTITVQYPNASPESVESDVTVPLETALTVLAGVKRIRSNSWNGISQTYVDFERDIDPAKLETTIRDVVAATRATFPPTAGEPVIEWQTSTPSR